MTFREDFADQVVTAASPSEKVFLKLRGTGWLDVTFDSGYYARASTVDMETQLTRAARLLFIERTRAMYAGLSTEVGERVEPGHDRLHRKAREYRERLDELTAQGASPGGDITLTGIGLGNFTVTVQPGTLDKLSEDEFRAAGAAAGVAFLDDYEDKIALLKYDVYYREMAERHGLELGI